MDTKEKVKSRWTRSFFTGLNMKGDEERYICEICQKDFASPSNLALHSQVHVIERKFKCEPCQVSFHSQGHLQKHKRSSAHETRVQMTQAFGVPTSDNPRPYGCPECDTAFRKHGHLAKHLRSKSHITKLESNGLIPVGTYAALDKCGQDLKDKLITTNSEQSLQSIRQIAMQLFNLQPTSNEPQSYQASLDAMYNINPSGPTHPSSSMTAHLQPSISFPPPSQHQPPSPPLNQIPSATYYTPTQAISISSIQHTMQQLPPPPPPQATSQVPVFVHGPNMILTPQIHHQYAAAHPQPHQQHQPHHQHLHQNQHLHQHQQPLQTQPQIESNFHYNEDPNSQMMLAHLMMPHQLQSQSLDYTMRR